MRTWLPVTSAPDVVRQSNWRCIIMAADGLICLLPDKKIWRSKMLTLLIQEARLSATMRGVEMDCREALYPGCIGVTEKAHFIQSFWQKIKIVGRHSLQKIFAYLMVLSLLLIFARVWC